MQAGNEIIADEAPEAVLNGTAVAENQELTDEEGTAEAAPTLEEQLATAQAEAADYKDRWLRSQAEFANARKRMEKERIELYSMATADVIKKLLPVLDDFERALNTVPDSIRDNAWLEGIDLVQRKLFTILENFNVTPIEAVGQPFDPNWHEAITQEPADEYKSGDICRELQKGYKIGDRVIRPSLVAVAE
ncbi:MAG: nucleotide exchange factor GrpE [Chloroflexi bacterium]|nr:nucleotide exchange factor GrpE [Ardenticatenaceae bacterium]MBL1127372.1 nucleotide exchange factor GrpE [Chloroflexota bacterium]NOG33434.1 nucleotide exchange factor GrpE [Chloroflexota bacterium]GIK58554.1 MAG: protein GrpE [Chloroflexota bacterium]